MSGTILLRALRVYLWATHFSMTKSWILALPHNMTILDIDHEMISTVILPFWLIQEGQLSATGQSMCTKP